MSWITDRRDWFKTLGLTSLAAFGARRAVLAAPPAAGNLYEGIGVRPVINCRGTFTILSGSQSLPEVKKAMHDASLHYVHLDELMAGVGARLAEICKSEWGIVTNGCAAALTHSTAACVAGADPERMQRLPRIDWAKNEVVMPAQSRNVYDHAIRMAGVTMVTPTTREEFAAALGPKTAMIALLGETLDRHPMKLEEMAALAKPLGIPIIVDAAAERLTIPNTYLTRGADLVAYSGGKCLRGPQAAGLLLGRKDILEAAWLNSAPHHAFGRSLKVGKEEIMGMLAAVEAWTTRDHDAEWKTWEAWLETIRKSVEAVPGVTTEKVQPNGPSNNAPQLRIRWDAAKLGITPQQAADRLAAGSPRVIVPASQSGLSIMPYMMMPGDDAIAARAIAAALKSGPIAKPEPAAPSANLTGQWDVDLTFGRGVARHTVFLEQTAAALRGSHRAEFLSGDVTGSLDGATAAFRSNLRYEGTSIGYNFRGTVANGELRGTVDMGEYGKAAFTARRHFRA